MSKFTSLETSTRSQALFNVLIYYLDNKQRFFIYQLRNYIVCNKKMRNKNTYYWNIKNHKLYPGTRYIFLKKWNIQKSFGKVLSSPNASHCHYYHKTIKMHRSIWSTFEFYNSRTTKIVLPSFGIFISFILIPFSQNISICSQFYPTWSTILSCII